MWGYGAVKESFIVFPVVGRATGKGDKRSRASLWGLSKPGWSVGRENIRLGSNHKLYTHWNTLRLTTGKQFVSQLCQNKGRILYIKDATFALGCFILSGTELINIKSSVPRFVLFTSLPPQDFSSFLYKSSGWLWSAKHHIWGSVCPGANANLFTLTLSLHLSFSQLESLTLSVRGA